MSQATSVAQNSTMNSFVIFFCALGLFTTCSALSPRITSRITPKSLSLVERISTAAAATPDANCYPTPQDGKTQYIIGYGTLMKESYRVSPNPFSQDVLPIRVTGYSRGWNLRGAKVGFSTTYMGATRDRSGNFNGILIPLQFNGKASKVIEKYDQSEATSYCREKLSISNLEFLTEGRRAPGLENAEVWIYVTRPEYLAEPSKKFPLIQSYVDTFLTGCLEIEQKARLSGYTETCIKTTTGWSSHWVNDRIFPRKPFLDLKEAPKIDELLNKVIPKEFNRIVIE
jgi:hypothetical protein